MTTLIDTRRADARADDLHAIDVEAVNANAAKLYRKRTPIYPRLAHGKWRQLKWVAMAVLLAIYYVTPWIRWDRGAGRPDQAVLVDFAGRRFYFFAIELWPQEIYYITGLLILAALGIFLSSALFGRVWCGFACPQTVWTDLYIHVERFFEGDRAARMRHEKAPLSLDKAGRKIGKHAVWLLIAAVTGGAWIFYFGDAPTIAHALLNGVASPSALLFAGLLTFTTYTLAGTMREQVCIYMCPWPRIQAAMTDRDALNVTYRSYRGEPRGPHKKGATWAGRGHCIDCRQCVAVCPQGIDIRDGDQLECINCALCIDACDAIMDKVGLPRGLIAYDSWENVARKSRGEAGGLRLLRPRTILYAALFAAVGLAMAGALLTRTSLVLDAMRDRSPPYVKLASGAVRNGYTVRLINKSARARDVVLRMEGLHGATLEALNQPTPGAVTLRAAADTVTTARIYVAAPAQPDPTTDFTMIVTDPATGETARRTVVFMSGGQK